MPSPRPPRSRSRWPSRESSLRDFRDAYQGQFRANLRGPMLPSAWSYACPFQRLLRGWFDLHQLGTLCGIGVQQLQGTAILILAEERSLGHREKAANGGKSVLHSSGLVAAAHHAVHALGIAALGAVVIPVGAVEQFLEGVRIAVLQQVAGLLPAKDVVGGHAPGGALVVALAHQEFEEERRHIELP